MLHMCVFQFHSVLRAETYREIIYIYISIERERDKERREKMEGKKQVGSSSSSSFTNDLFGSKDSSASSAIIGAIFSPSSKALGKEVSESNKIPGNESSKAKDVANGKEDEKPKGDGGSIYQEQRMQQPCSLSSSIYYGGQDIYHPPQGPNSTIKKDVGEDDSGSASRGNWWQGSLYY